MKLLLVFLMGLSSALAQEATVEKLDVRARKYNRNFNISGPESMAQGIYRKILVTSVADGKIYSMDSRVGSKKILVFADFTKLKNWKKTDRIVGMINDPDGNIFVVSPDYDNGSIFFIDKENGYQDNNIIQVVKNAGRLNDIHIDKDSGMLFTTRQEQSGEVQKYNLQSLYYRSMERTIHTYSESVNHLAEVSMPNGITMGHAGKLMVTASELTSSYIKEIDTATGNVQEFKELGFNKWPDGLLYSEKHNQYLLTDNLNGTIESINTDGETVKKIELNVGEENISPANIYIQDDYIYIADLWYPSMTNLLKYEFSDALKVFGDKFKKENIHTYHHNIYVLFEEDLF